MICIFGTYICKILHIRKVKCAKKKKAFWRTISEKPFFAKKLEIMTINDIDDNFCPYKML